MKQFSKYLEEVSKEKLIIESFLDEMANLHPEETGMDYVIWIGEVGGQHGPRIKVSNTKGKMNKTDCFVMSIAKEPQVLTTKSCKLTTSKLEDLSDWIKLNYDILMKMWNAYETGTGSLAKLILQLKSL